ncbi:MAG: hypothetical protein ACKE5M_04825 [Methylophilaceae bacterium]
MKNYDFIFFTTCDANEERINNLLRLLDSIDHAIHKQNVRVKHYILLQRVIEVPKQLSSKLSKDREFTVENARLSLSRARNIMLNKAIKDSAFHNAEVCAFPDDDAWYPSGFLAVLINYLRSKPNISIFTCDYGTNPFAKVTEVSDLRINPKPTDPGEFIRNVSSNTLFLRSDLALSNVFFDEKLGVGAKINGGEDLDYALRAYTKAGNKVVMSKAKLIGHRDRLPWVRSAYFAGSLFAIARSARNDKSIFIQMLRKVIVGFYLVLRRELKLSAYLQGLKLGTTGFFRQKLEVGNFD